MHAHLLDEADFLPGPRADVRGHRLGHLVQLVRVQARPVLAHGQGFSVIGFSMMSAKETDHRLEQQLQKPLTAVRAATMLGLIQQHGETAERCDPLSSAPACSGCSG